MRISPFSGKMLQCEIFTHFLFTFYFDVGQMTRFEPFCFNSKLVGDELKVASAILLFLLKLTLFYIKLLAHFRFPTAARLVRK